MKKEFKEPIYVGTKEVDKYHIEEKADLVGVLYKDGEPQDFTLRQWEEVKSDKEYPDTEVPVKQYAPLMREIMALMLKERVPVSSNGWLLQRISELIMERYDESICRLFNVDKLNEILIADVHNVLGGSLEKEEDTQIGKNPKED
jgi:hypothetical protein